MSKRYRSGQTKDIDEKKGIQLESGKCRCYKIVGEKLGCFMLAIFNSNKFMELNLIFTANMVFGAVILKSMS